MLQISCTANLRETALLYVYNSTTISQARYNRPPASNALPYAIRSVFHLPVGPLGDSPTQLVIPGLREHLPRAFLLVSSLTQAQHPGWDLFELAPGACLPARSRTTPGPHPRQSRT